MMSAWVLVALLAMVSADHMIFTQDEDGNLVQEDQPMADPYMADDWMAADWNQDWALLSGRLHQPKCVDIPTNMSLCKQIGYTQMRLPNLLEHDTLQEVTSQATSWTPLLGIRCHPDTKLFLCSLFSPVCLDRPIWPCRSLCEAVQHSCQSYMNKYGYPWPEMLRCDKFPLDNDLCIGLQNDNKPDDRVCEPCNKPDTFEGIIDNFCSSEIALRVTVSETVISEGYLKVITEGKTRAYKKGDLRKRDLQDLLLYIADGEHCECPAADTAGSTPGYVLVMGRTGPDGRMLITYAQKYEKSSRDLRKALRAIRSGELCDGDIPRLSYDNGTTDEVTESPPSNPDTSTKRNKKRNKKRNRNRDRERDRPRDDRRRERDQGRKKKKDRRDRRGRSRKGTDDQN